MNFNHLSDQTILEALGKRFKAARLNQDLGISDLAQLTGLSGKTISHLENGNKSVGLLNIIAVLRSLDMLDELEGFIPEPPPRAAAILKQSGHIGIKRQRASGKRKKDEALKTHTDWKWDE